MRILLVPDVPNWAWDRKSDAIIKYLSKHVEKIDKVYNAHFNTWFIEAYDLVHFFGWLEGLKYPEKVTSAVSSYNYCIKHWDEAKKHLKRYKAITAVSRLLYEKLKKENMNKNIVCMPNGVDHTVFYPKGKKNDKKFIVGWLGQPTRGVINDKGRHIDQHGYEHVLQPLIKKIKKTNNIEIKLIENTWQNALPHSEVMKFYNSCDCVIHTGYLTGTPNPIFEAASCGIPVICTRIGAAVDMIKDGVNGYLIDSYSNEYEANETINKFLKLINDMSNDRNYCKKMGIAARDIIEKDWTWEKRSMDYLPFFKKYHVKKKR